MKRLKSLLRNQHLNAIHEKINFLGQLNLLWDKIVPRDFLSYTKVANYSDGKLVIIVPHSGWATRLRYESPQLVQQLRQYAEFKALETISCKISGEFARIERELEQSLALVSLHSLSQTAISSIIGIADGLSQSPLKQALLKLAGKNRTEEPS